MKKYLITFAVIAIALVSCQKNNGTNAGLFEASLSLSKELGVLTYGEPVNISGDVTSSENIDAFIITGVKGDAGEYKAVGEAQEFKADGNKISGDFFADNKEINGLEIVLKSGSKAKAFFFAVKGVSGEAKGDVWMNDAVSLTADRKIDTHDNNPAAYPNPGSGAGSDTKSFFSMHGVKINGKKEHILSLNQLRKVEGQNGGLCFLNCLQNTQKNIYIGSQRGYMFSTLNASQLGGGTTGRQCDLYEVEGKGIKDKNIDFNFGMKLVCGEWKNEDELHKKVFKFVDSLFVQIKAGDSNLAKLKAFYQLGEIQRKLDNATLGNEDEPTNLTKQKFLRRWAEAGDKSTKPLVENFRAGDYIIISSKRGTEEAPKYYYGIACVLMLPDDAFAFKTNEKGKKYIDKDLADQLFEKSIYLDIKTQCELSE